MAERIVAEERFRLSNPSQTVPGIMAALALGTNKEPFLPSLLLASAEAVRAPSAKKRAASQAAIVAEGNLPDRGEAIDALIAYLAEMSKTKTK